MSAELNELAVRSRKDRTALASLLKQLHSGFVTRIRASKIHRNDREDAVQEVLMKVMHCVDVYDPLQGDFENFVNHAVSNLLTSFYDKQVKHHLRNESKDNWLKDSVEAKPAPAPAPAKVDELETIPPEHRDIVRDYYGIGLRRSFSINQIAARRKIPNERVRLVLVESVKKMGGLACV